MTKTVWTIAFDTICQGPQPCNLNDEPMRFASRSEAEREIASDPEFYHDCFALPLEEIGRKIIYTGSKE